jgi:hypothetical protein
VTLLSVGFVVKSVGDTNIGLAATPERHQRPILAMENRTN